jgi:hypothetical protein
MGGTAPGVYPVPAMHQTLDRRPIDAWAARISNQTF